MLQITVKLTVRDLTWLWRALAWIACIQLL